MIVAHWTVSVFHFVVSEQVTKWTSEFSQLVTFIAKNVLTFSTCPIVFFYFRSAHITVYFLLPFICYFSTKVKWIAKSYILCRLNSFVCLKLIRQSFLLNSPANQVSFCFFELKSIFLAPAVRLSLILFFVDVVLYFVKFFVLNTSQELNELGFTFEETLYIIKKLLSRRIIII